MDWTFWYFVGLAWLSLAFLWLPALVAALTAAWRGHGSAVDAFLARHGSLLGSLVSTGVTAIGVLAAWVAVQSQIQAGNETTRAQVEAVVKTTNQQIEEARKQHRLEYLRQYLGQLEPAVTWLRKADRQRFDVSLYARDDEPYKSQQLKDLDDEIAFMNSMPQMPFYNDNGTRPADRRDDIVEAIKRYRIALAEPKRIDPYRTDDKTEKAAAAVRAADSWSNDYIAVWRMEEDAREELKKLESEIEYHPKPF